jgi:hypothetical protein
MTQAVHLRIVCELFDVHTAVWKCTALTIDVIVPLVRPETIDRLLYSFRWNRTWPDLITIVSNEIDNDIHVHGLPVRLIRFRSSVYRWATGMSHCAEISASGSRLVRTLDIIANKFLRLPAVHSKVV